MPDLATDSLNSVLHGPDYYRVAGVPVFDAHDETDRAGNVVDHFDLARLERMARKANERARLTGDLSPFGPGHTTDDGAEEDQPPVWGYLANFRVGTYGPARRTAILADFLVRKRIPRRLPDGRLVYEDGMDVWRSYPRRSVELWAKEDLIDWVALLRRTPERDLGLALATGEPNPPGGDGARLVYMKQISKAPAPVGVVSTNGKIRYSKELHAMADPTDPTTPPDANEPVTVTADADATPPDQLPPEEAQTAEKFAKHVFGLHPHHLRKLMTHLHKKYAMEAGCADEPERYDAAGGVPGATDAFVPGDGQEERMKKYQADIQKNRYSKLEADNAALQARIATLEASAMHAEWEAELVQMQAAGYPVDPVQELKDCKARKYSRERFREHVETIRRFSKAAPVNLPPVEAAAPAPAEASGAVTREQSRKAVNLVRSEGISFDAALAKVRAAG